MRKQSTDKQRKGQQQDMRAEYRLDYTKARPNRFAGRIDGQQLVVVLDPDVAEVFSTSESVNSALRALITAQPKLSRIRKRA